MELILNITSIIFMASVVLILFCFALFVLSLLFKSNTFSDIISTLAIIFVFTGITSLGMLLILVCFFGVK